MNNIKSMSESNASESDRRDFFRFDDSLTLNVRVLDQESIDSITSDFDGFRSRYCMKSHIQNQSNNRIPQLMRIRSRDSEIATYVEHLEQQIAFLAERLDQISRVSEEGIEISGQVNISATGIRFDSHIPLNVGDVVDIRMLLSTQNIQVVVLGSVQRAEDQANGKHTISVHYTHIHAEDIEIIVQHLAKLQQIKLQAARLEDD